MATESFKVMQSFGRELGRETYKLLVQAKDGNRYLVWHFNEIEANAGTEVLITIDYYNNWRQINNPSNGKQGNITDVNKVN
ncbi:MAG: hypothetical protein U7127_24150 [Phormidium sp.]|jgi:hypothetical protein